MSDVSAEAALGVVEAYCGWSLEQQSLQVECDSDGGAVVVLPSLFVRSVESVTLRGVDSRSEAFRDLVEDFDWEWSTNGVLRWLGPGRGWPRGARRVQVSFMSGYDELPAAVLSVVASVAERVALAKTVQARLENVGGIQTNTTYAQSETGGVGLLPLEAAVLDRYCIVTAR